MVRHVFAHLLTQRQTLLRQLSHGHNQPPRACTLGLSGSCPCLVRSRLLQAWCCVQSSMVRRVQHVLRCAPLCTRSHTAPTAKHRPLFMAALHAIAVLSKLYTIMFFHHSYLTSLVLKMMLVDLLLPTLLAAIYLPISFNHTLISAPLNAVGTIVWVQGPPNGMCHQVCSRAGLVGEDKDVSLLITYAGLYAHVDHDSTWSIHIH